MAEELERVYEAILETLREGRPAAVVTVTRVGGSTPRGVGAKMLVLDDGSTVGTVGGGEVEARAIEAALAAIGEGRCLELTHRPAGGEAGQADVCGEEMHLFIEVLPPRPTLLIIGGGHVGQAVAELGTFLGYRVAVVDERPEMVGPERFPQASVRLAGDPAERVAQLPIGEQTYVVIVTPHHSPDERVLAVLAERPVAYVGLLGSRRRTEQTFRRAREAGVPEAFLERVRTPIGLDIGAETPREIALSILAEIIGVQRGKV